MKEMGLNEIRAKFLEFFKSKDHLVESSFSLVPKTDKSLLLINAGMAPLKDYFTGVEKPPHHRMVTCQKCIRTGDIENVGVTSRHATFFEMLGNFSFGDYFKDDAIKWGWEFVTEVLEIPKDNLWVSIYLDDDEAFDIWKDKIGIPEDRIVRLGKEDNFWEIGTGPCGPCSEIYYDRGPEFSCGDPNHTLGCDCDQFLEFWNLVFTQFSKNEDGTYSPLKKKNIDTGMGLERIAAIMQGVDSIFEVDTIKKVLDKVVQISNKTYGDNLKDDISIRIITDHVRAVTFLISDGVMPNNEGRGYVLRRLLRRSARHGKLLGINEIFLNQIVDVVIEQSGEAYPDLIEKRDYINKIVGIEEEKFNQTIDQGIERLQSYIKELNKDKENVLSGSNAFKLYDTFGFPLDLTREILEEIGKSVDEDSFNAEMEKQRKRARKAREIDGELNWENGDSKLLEKFSVTNFVGYDLLENSSKVLAIISNESLVENATKGDEIDLIVESTPFYAEAGGQVGDTGLIVGNNLKIEVIECKKTKNDIFIHKCKVIAGEISVSDEVILKVDEKRRNNIERNHTSTHLLHKALKIVLGDHVQQAGSYVDDKRLRFDFAHFSPITDGEIKRIEDIVNTEILKAVNVEIINTTLEKAKTLGAISLFNEKYSNDVRIVKVGEFSMELCGGTHIENSAKAGLIKIVSEGGIASGVRRIEAVTGFNAIDYYNDIENTFNKVVKIVKSEKEEIVSKTEQLANQFKKVSKEMNQLKSKMASSNISELIENKIIVQDITIIRFAYNNVDVTTIREIGDKLKDRLDDYLIVLASITGDTAIFVVMASEGAISKGLNAGTVVKEIVKITDGKGGGKPSNAQAGGANAKKVDLALEKVEQIVKSMV